MGQGCQRLASKLLEMLDGLKVTGTGGWRSWNALRKSLAQRVTKKKEIEDIALQLNAYRQQISTHLLAILRCDHAREHVILCQPDDFLEKQCGSHTDRIDAGTTRVPHSRSYATSKKTINDYIRRRWRR